MSGAVRHWRTLNKLTRGGRKIEELRTCKYCILFESSVDRPVFSDLEQHEASWAICALSLSGDDSWLDAEQETETGCHCFVSDDVIQRNYRYSSVDALEAEI
jgi:hypothetical protein